jgi:PAS domain S-box-containing protein
MSVEIPPRPSVNVLLVDDRTDKLLALESILADGDHRIVTAHSGAEALRALLRDEFAVILLDVNMPQLDGFQTATLIRGRPRSEKTPIIFMTAVNDLESGTSRGYSLGPSTTSTFRWPRGPQGEVSVFVDLYRKREQIRQQAESSDGRRSGSTRDASPRPPTAWSSRPATGSSPRPDMLGVAGFDGRLRQLNASWERTLGRSARELCERPVFEFLHPEDRQGMRDHLRDLSEGAPTARFENRHRHGDGSYRWLSWTAAPFREEGLVYLFVRDITFRKVAEEERLQLVREQEARRAAERENEIKDQFLATLSHELRSPLTPILGWTSMLRSGQLAPPDAARALDVIERNARLQAQLIEDLLDVTRIVSGKLRMDLRPVDLRVVVEAGLDAVRTAALKRRIALAVELGPEPVRVVGDPERLQQVVWNLASNAVKFSNEGGSVRVNLDVEADTARLRVCDDGVGISAEFLPHVFDRFRQATAGSTRTHGGLGGPHHRTAHRACPWRHGRGRERGCRAGACSPSCCRGMRTAGASVPASRPRPGRAGGGGPALAGRVVRGDDEADVRDVLRLVLSGTVRGRDRGLRGGGPRERRGREPRLVVSDIGMPGADGYAHG